MCNLFKRILCRTAIHQPRTANFACMQLVESPINMDHSLLTRIFFPKIGRPRSGEDMGDYIGPNVQYVILFKGNIYLYNI